MYYLYFTQGNFKSVLPRDFNGNEVFCQQKSTRTVGY
jgi:hypothetical protein